MSGEALDTSIDASLFHLRDASNDKPSDDERRRSHDVARVPYTDYEPIVVEFVHNGDSDLGWVPYFDLGPYPMEDEARDDFFELFFEATAMLDAQCHPVKKGSRTSGSPEEREKE